MSNSDYKNGPFLLDLATVTGLITALVYFTGWTFAYNYFGYFNLGLLTQDIPTEYFFIYGFWVFKTWWGVVVFYGLGIALLALGITILPARLNRIKMLKPELVKQLPILLALLSFLLAWWLSSVCVTRHYQEQQKNGFSSYPLVRVWPTHPLPEDSELKEFYKELPKGVYHLFLESKNMLFLFKVPSDGKPAQLPITELPREEVKMLRILP